MRFNGHDASPVKGTEDRKQETGRPVFDPAACAFIRNPCFLFPVPCSLSPVPVPCSLSPVPCPLFPVPCSLSPVPVPCPLNHQTRRLNRTIRQPQRRDYALTSSLGRPQV